MSDKGWLCVICGHFIHETLPNEILPEGGRVHTYCLEAEKVGAADERERIINAIESYRSEIPLDGMFDNIIGIDEVIALIKGEQK